MTDFWRIRTIWWRCSHVTSSMVNHRMFCYHGGIETFMAPKVDERWCFDDDGCLFRSCYYLAITKRKYDRFLAYYDDKMVL